MIKKQEIINILIDYGVSIIESDSLLDTKENFNNAIKDIQDKVLADYSLVELSHKAIVNIVLEWVKEQDKPEPDILGVPKIIVGKRQIQDLIKKLKAKSK